MNDSAQRLRNLILEREPDLPAIAGELDDCALADAITAARSLSGRRVQRALWRAVGTNARVSVTDFVPVDYEPMKPVVFHGKNSLPAFTEFEKICCRPEGGGQGDVLWGYNEGKLRPVIGPGYYVVHDTGNDPLGGAAFDYRLLPPSHPQGWPSIKPNSAGVSRFVYNNMVDYMRRVSERVFIGSATRNGKEIDSYFLLVREIDR